MDSTERRKIKKNDSSSSSIKSSSSENLKMLSDGSDCDESVPKTPMKKVPSRLKQAFKLTQIGAS